MARQGAGVREGANTTALIGMRELAYRTRDLLADGDVNGVGRLLHDNWMLKRTVADGVTNDFIDSAYERALAGGALGGKLLGAGGGGFLLVHAPEHAQRNVRSALTDLREVSFRFSASGSQIRLVEQQW